MSAVITGETMAAIAAIKEVIAVIAVISKLSPPFPPKSYHTGGTGATKKEVPRMAEKKYTNEALEDAERLAKILAKVPRERKPLVTMMASAFIAGAEAQAQLTAPNGSTRQ